LSPRPDELSFNREIGLRSDVVGILPRPVQLTAVAHLIGQQHVWCCGQGSVPKSPLIGVQSAP